MPSSPAFDAYVGNASAGPNSLPRIVLASFIVVVFWFAATLAVLLAAAGIAASIEPVPGPFNFAAYMDNLGRSRLWIVSLLVSVAALWPALALALRLVHGRRLSSLYSPERRIDRSDFLRGLAAGALIAVVSVLVGLLIDPEIWPTSVGWLHWLAALPILAAIIFLQSSAEELMFRGYLMQSLAARFRSPAVWAVVPVVAFAAIHWNPAASLHMNAAGLVGISPLAAVLALLVWRTGNLGAAFGAHAGNNLVALLLVSPEGNYVSSALLRVRSMTDPGWTVADALWSTLVGFAMAALLALVLLHPRSPLRVAPAAGPGSASAAATSSRA